MIPPSKLHTARKLAKQKELTLYQKRYLIRLFILACTGQEKTVTGDEDDLGFNEIFETAKEHFLKN